MSAARRDRRFFPEADFDLLRRALEPRPRERFNAIRSYLLDHVVLVTEAAERFRRAEAAA